MELGALQCASQNPDCGLCPLKDKCVAFASGNVQAYPVKQNKTKTRDRYFHYLYIIYKGQTWMNRRMGKDIWTGLYEFPLIETDHAMDFSGLCETQAFRNHIGRCWKIEYHPRVIECKAYALPSNFIRFFLSNRDRAGSGILGELSLFALPGY